MKRLLNCICLPLLLVAVPSMLFAQGHKGPPNIVFIFADDLGYKDLGCYGNPYNKTPHIDSLALHGMRFTQSYAASPVCSPSRAGLLTGKYPARLQLTNFLVGLRTDSLSPVLPAVYRHFLSPEEITLPQLLKQKGYASGIVGKWHLGSGNGLEPHQRGFEYDRVIAKNGLDYYNYSISSKGKTIFEDNGQSYLTDKLTGYGLEFIEQNKNKPFFLYLAYSAPHVFIIPRGDKLKNYFLRYNQFNGKYNPYYGAMLESVDDGVGLIVDKIKSLGLDDNTIIVFTSDNGGVGLDELGPTPTHIEPLRAWKGHVYEGGIRVPAIIRWPDKIKEGVVNDNYFMNTDYLPTFLEIAGIHSLPEKVDGKSILSSLMNPTANLERGAIFWHYPHFSNQLGRPAGAVRLGDFKLVESYETGMVELYNLREDISEAHDLSEVMPQKTKELSELLKRWRKEVNANMPLPNPQYRK
ncbi:MAG TPA: sulfatase [Agriterribacter sp.]|nr:sulfatase [Agriterribacter sp.]